MNYINNFNRPITLGAAATTVALDLPDGTFRLCISNAARTQLEVLDAAVTSGAAALTRGLEGTTAQEWPEGSSVYASVTAGMLAGFGGGGGALISGAGDPDGVTAPAGTHYSDTTRDAVWYATEANYFAQLQLQIQPPLDWSSNTITSDFQGDLSGVLLPGEAWTFAAGFADIRTNATLAVVGSTRTFTATGQPHHFKLYAPGDGTALFIVTPLTISTAP